MAMIKCTECGSDVSDRAPACPNCGVLTPGGNCSLVFVRPKLFGATTSLSVFVNGQPYGKLRPKGKVVVEVSPGTHHVEIQSSTGRSTVSTITAAGSEVEVNVGLGLTGAAKLS